MKKIFVTFLACCLLLASCTSCSKLAKGGSTTSSTSPETSEFKTYSSNFTASGTNAAQYNANLDEFIKTFGSYFTRKGELNKITGYDKPFTVNTTDWISSNIEDAYSQFGKEYGETMYNNRWFDAFKRAYNIDVKYKWLAQDADYEQKLRLEMTSNPTTCRMFFSSGIKTICLSLQTRVLFVI